MDEVIRLKDAKYLDFSGSKNTDMAISELRNAKKCRETRESQFDKSLISGSEITKYAQSIADEINMRARAMPLQAFDIGKLLLDVKRILPHGSFDKWISENLTFSKSTALNYMNIYRGCMGHSEVLGFFRLSILTEVCSPRFPEDLRLEIFNNVEGVFDIKQKELHKLAFKFRRKKVDIDSPEVQKFLKIEKAKSEYNKYKAKLNSLKNILEKQLREFEELNKKKTSYPILKEENDENYKRYSEIESMILGFIIETGKMIETLRPEE